MADIEKKNEKKGAKSAERSVSFMDGVKSELRRVSWASASQVRSETVRVTAVAAVLGAAIAVMDFAFQYGVNLVTSLI